MVALKKVRMEKEREGIPLTALREIKLLRSLNHTNIVRLLDIIATPKQERFVRVLHGDGGSHVPLHRVLLTFGLGSRCPCNLTPARLATVSTWCLSTAIMT